MQQPTLHCFHQSKLRLPVLPCVPLINLSYPRDFASPTSRRGTLYGIKYHYPERELDYGVTLNQLSLRRCWDEKNEYKVFSVGSRLFSTKSAGSCGQLWCQNRREYWTHVGSPLLGIHCCSHGKRVKETKKNTLHALLRGRGVKHSALLRTIRNYIYYKQLRIPCLLYTSPSPRD